MKGLKNLKVVVTGSTQGIGLAIAREFLENGSRVVINSYLKECDQELLKELKELGEVYFISADLSTEDGPSALISESAKLLGGLDCLVNNAGTFDDHKDFLELDASNFSKTFNLNVRGYLLTSQAFAKYVGQRNYDASIVCIGSINSLQAEKGSVLYDASKGAVLMLIRSLAVELADQGIRVNGVGPGSVNTPLTAKVQENKPLVKLLCTQTPMKRLGEPEDIAGAVNFLASQSAIYITGQMLYVDGGVAALQLNRDLAL